MTFVASLRLSQLKDYSPANCRISYGCIYTIIDKLINVERIINFIYINDAAAHITMGAPGRLPNIQAPLSQVTIRFEILAHHFF